MRSLASFQLVCLLGSVLLSLPTAECFGWHGRGRLAVGMRLQAAGEDVSWTTNLPRFNKICLVENPIEALSFDKEPFTLYYNANLDQEFVHSLHKDNDSKYCTTVAVDKSELWEKLKGFVKVNFPFWDFQVSDVLDQNTLQEAGLAEPSSSVTGIYQDQKFHVHAIMAGTPNDFVDVQTVRLLDTKLGSNFGVTFYRNSALCMGVHSKAALSIQFEPSDSQPSLKISLV
jgi:hypothetical protein